ncbi:hypothetical protein Ancab_035199 [Ancistrocladus abbreviatus]
MQTMVMSMSQLLFFALFSLFCLQGATSLPSAQPIPLLSLRIKPNRTANTCSYTVDITTSCSSVSYTRDQISLSFGDAYGNQVFLSTMNS